MWISSFGARITPAATRSLVLSLAMRAVGTVDVERPGEGVAAGARDDVDDRRPALGFAEVAEARDHHFDGLDGVRPVLRRSRCARPDTDAADLQAARFRPGGADRAVRGKAAVHRRHQDRRDVGGRAGDRHVGQDFLVDDLRLPRALDIDNRAGAGDGDGFFHAPHAQLRVHGRHHRAGELEAFPLDHTEARRARRSPCRCRFRAR